MTPRSPSDGNLRLGFETNGRVRVMALDISAGKLAQAAIKNQAGLSEDEIQREKAFLGSLNIR